MDEQPQRTTPGFSPVAPVAPGLPQQPRHPKKLSWLVAGIIVAILVVGFVVLAKSKTPTKSTSKTLGNTEAATELYRALGNAAKQQKLRVAMYRVTYANKADADAKQNPGTFASSVSEVDTKGGHYRSVFVHDLVQEDKSFTVGRCLNGVTYIDIYSSPPAKNTRRAKTLAEASQRLSLLPNGNLDKVTEPLVFIACPRLGLIPASPPLAVARLSDGVFPVTLSDQQAASWVQKLEQAALFNVKDEGKVEKDGKQLEKLSFTPKDEQKANQALYDIFYTTGEIDKIKQQHPDAKWEYEFQAINPFNTGSVGGYYLIDEQTELPVYSELYGTNPDKQTNGSPAAGKNIARTKQTYAYPEDLTIDLDTPLEFLE